MTGCTYEIIRCPYREPETIIEANLAWEEADAKRNALAAKERSTDGKTSNWTRTLFEVRMDKESASKVSAQQQAARSAACTAATNEPKGERPHGTL